MKPMLLIAIRAVRTAGNFISKYYDNINYTSNNDNYLIDTINKKTENIIYNIIQKSYPTHIINNINNIKIKNTKNIIQWIINPLDGKINFLKKIPYFSISIVVRINNCTEIAIIYNPILNELFTAVKGYGTQLNNYRLRINNNKKLNTLIFSIVININNIKLLTKNVFNNINTLSNKTIDFRYTGSNSLDIAYVAANRNDIFVGINLQTSKFYAEKLIIKEAGGICTDFNIQSNNINEINIIAGNYNIVKLWYQYINNLNIKNN